MGCWWWFHADVPRKTGSGPLAPGLEILALVGPKVAGWFANE
jgi:hypothetical protein